MDVLSRTECCSFDFEFECEVIGAEKMAGVCEDLSRKKAVSRKKHKSM